MEALAKSFDHLDEDGAQNRCLIIFIGNVTSNLAFRLCTRAHLRWRNNLFYLL